MPDYPGHVIRIGDDNRSAIRQIQTQLRALNFGSLDSDGIFGPKTRSAVRLFQAHHLDGLGRPLVIDGEVGALTWAALFSDESVGEVSSPPTDFLGAVLEIAASQLGVREQPRNSNSGPKVDDYLMRVGISPAWPAHKKPWCAAFLYWCFDEAARNVGRPNPLAKTAGCLDHWNKAPGRGARRVLGWKAVNDPALVQPGMVFIMDFGSGRGHTGLVEAVRGGFIATIEGNTDASGTNEGGGVYRLERKLNAINKGFIDYADV